MATFLRTSKMSPALAKRVEASVRGKPKTGRERWRSLRALIRVVLVLSIAAAAFTVVKSERQKRRDREAARTALLDLVRAETAPVTDDDRRSVVAVEALLLRLAGPPAPDHVADDLRTPERLRALLERPMVYIRGPLSSFTSTTGIQDAAKESAKDALVACLFDPPASRAEKVVLAKARVGYPGSARLEELTPNVRRVDDARVGLPFLSPDWASSVKAAQDQAEIEALSARFKRAPLARAKEALRAELLMVAMDDTASGSGPTELDGARAHDVRFAIAEIRSSSILVQLKRHVDPSWISIAQRAQHASKLDSCLLAMDLRDAFTPRR